ncbi:MAG: FMN-binding protein [Clostridiaceae bacterium]
MKKGYLYTVIFMIIMASLFTALLATAQTTVNPQIKENQEIGRQRNLLYAFNIPTGTTNDEVKAAYTKYIQPETRTIDGKTVEAFKLVDDAGATQGYAFPFSGPALWGTISGYLSTSSDLTTIKGLTFTAQNETPGLGGRIDEAPFKEQWRDVPMPTGDIKYGPVGDKQLDAISGATQSSNAVTKALNEVKNTILSKWEVQ